MYQSLDEDLTPKSTKKDLNLTPKNRVKVDTLFHNSEIPLSSAKMSATQIYPKLKFTAANQVGNVGKRFTHKLSLNDPNSSRTHYQTDNND